MKGISASCNQKPAILLKSDTSTFNGRAKAAISGSYCTRGRSMKTYCIYCIRTWACKGEFWIFGKVTTPFQVYGCLPTGSSTSHQISSRNNGFGVLLRDELMHAADNEVSSYRKGLLGHFGPAIPQDDTTKVQRGTRR